MTTVLDRVPRRMYNQYADKPKLVDWIAIARKMGGSMADAINAVRFSYDIDSATGEQLDVIGRIVVIDRSFMNFIELDAKQFSDGDPYAQCGDPESMFSEASIASDDKMSDGLFRMLIKAKILKNTGDATVESIVKQMKVLIGAEFLRVNDTEDMSFSIEFSGANLTPIERYALFNIDLVQRPQGVNFRGFTEISDVAMFGDEEVQFGDFVNAQFSDFSGASLPPTPLPTRIVVPVHFNESVASHIVSRIIVDIFPEGYNP